VIPLCAPGRTRSWTDWFGEPVSSLSCVLGWIVATVVFVGFTRLLGGPSGGDSVVSVYSTWAIAHGQIACAYPSAKVGPFPFIAPMWPLISGAISALFGVGHGVPFPSQVAMGPHCSKAIASMWRWSQRSGAAAPTLRIAYLSWLFVMAGAVALLRASRRGRQRWEPATLILLACAPPVWISLEQFFHPCDLVTVGFILCSVAFVRRGHWAWAGAILGLAVMTDQFALLVLAPLVVVAPTNRRLRFIGGAAAVAALVALPLMVITSGRAARAIVLGSGDTKSAGGTVLWELHLHGAELVACSRVLPIVLSVVLAGWAVRRLGSGVLEPVPLVSLLATSLALRLVFEVNLWGYYFMATTVMLILVQVVRGRFNLWLIGWIVLVTLVFDPPPWRNDSFGHAIPVWLGQITLVPLALVLAVAPLIVAARAPSRLHVDSSPDPDRVPVHA
jgi:hypothetical protein